MHPIFLHRQRLGLYLLAWAPLTALLVVLMVVVGGSDWPEAATLAEPLVLVFSRPGGLAIAWSRRVADRTLTFRRRSVGPPVRFRLRDNETKTVWDALTGRAVEGELTGQALELQRSYLMLMSRFRAFHPEGEVLPLADGSDPTLPRSPEADPAEGKGDRDREGGRDEG